MKILKYVVLCLTLWGIPTFFAYDLSLGSKLSAVLYGLLLVYYFLVSKKRPLLPFIIFVLLYFIISGLIYVDSPKYYQTDFLKFLILVISGTELARNTTIKEFFIILILGASSILVHAVMFQDGYGRYSGFYLDPNGAGFVCLIGYCLSFSITTKSLKLFGQFLFTFAGIITFSRTFILLWILVSLIAIVSNRKNSVNFGLGIGVIVVVFSLATILQLNTVRFSAFQSILGNSTSQADIAVLEDDSRTATWATYYDMILKNPIFGNGYQALSGLDPTKQGVHNSFLMVLGEAGIMPFLLMIGIYFYMLKKSLAFFKTNVHYFLMTFSIFGILMTMHNYFSSYLVVFASLWIYTRVTETDEKKDLEEQNPWDLDNTVPLTEQPQNL
ncbi:MAG: O-antigen ligase family protein [Aquaticitalea sp.]